MSAFLHPNQISVAVQNGVDVDGLDSVFEAVAAIESALGKNAIEVRARWFFISVLRSLKKAKWRSLEESGLQDAEIQSLVQACLDVKGFSVSLKTLTKDDRSRYRMLSFASSKNLERGVLARGTKAYNIVARVIDESGVLATKVSSKDINEHKGSATNELRQTETPRLEPEHSAVKVANEDAPQQELSSTEIEKTVVARRAQRRGYSAAAQQAQPIAEEVKPPAGKDSSMSAEEFASLDAALSKKDSKIVQQDWGDQASEERLSRLLGLLAGLGLFAFVVFLFL